MENLPLTMTNANAKAGDVFKREFDPVTLQRPMRLFKGSLGLEIGKPGAPDPDFIFKLLTQYPTHKAMFRDKLGAVLYKSFENWVRGRSVSSTTLKRIAVAISLSPEKLEDFSKYLGSQESDSRHGDRHHLLPGLLDFVTSVVSAAKSLYEAVAVHGPRCPHCGGNCLQDIDIWWQRQPLRIGRTEYHFVETLLVALVVVNRFKLFGIGDPACSLTALAALPKHPIGNWLLRILEAYDVEDFHELCRQLPIAAEQDEPILQPRLKKWSCGEDLMPLARGQELIDALPIGSSQQAKSRLSAEFYAARCIAFIVDFVEAVALAEAPPARDVVQAVVRDRLLQIHENVDLAVKWTKSSLAAFLKSITGPSSQSQHSEAFNATAS